MKVVKAFLDQHVGNHHAKMRVDGGRKRALGAVRRQIGAITVRDGASFKQSGNAADPERLRLGNGYDPTLQQFRQLVQDVKRSPEATGTGMARATSCVAAMS
jgi:hypothetical protein